MIILLEENIAFLKEQVSKKDKVADSLLNQLSKQNDSAPHNNTSNTICTQIEFIADSKLTESSKISEKSNTERERETERETERQTERQRENENKNITHIGPKKSTPLHKNAGNASTKENADNSEDDSSINSCVINSKSKKSIVILGDSMLKHLNGWEMSKKKVRATARFLSSIFQAQQQIAWRIT